MKHIIALLDGTNDAAMRTNPRYAASNVFRVNEYLADYNDQQKSNPQMTLYFTGVGADYIWNRERSFFQAILSYLQALTSSGIEQQIVEAYVNISANYNAGDKVYVIGFSRGSVAAKILCDLVGLFGFIRSDQIHHFSDHWSLFAPPMKHPALDIEAISKISADHCHPPVDIEFLGMFDAVIGSTSLSRRPLARYIHNKKIHPQVRSCLHILSMDEERRPFSAVQFFGGNQSPVVNVWMPGCHSDVGGTYQVSSVKNWSLFTMLKHLSCAGITLKPSKMASLHKECMQSIVDTPFNLNQERGIWSLIPPSKRTPLKNPSNNEYECYIHPVAFYFYKSKIFISQKREITYGTEDLGAFADLSPFLRHDDEWQRYKQRFPAYVDPAKVMRESARKKAAPPVPTRAESAAAMR